MRGRAADLNLFPILVALERERNVTRAAAALGLSQPAVSHALKRLRDLYGDPLFARTPSGVEPTARARELVESVGGAVAMLEATVGCDVFDPATARDSFAVAMNNYAAITLAAPLVAEVSARAPHVSLAIRPSGTLDPAMLTRRGALDLCVDRLGRDVDHESRLLRDRHVVVMRRSHPLGEAGFGVEDFAGCAHLDISSSGEDPGVIDRILEGRGLRRKVRLAAPYIASAAIVAASDLVGVVALRVALAMCRDGALTWRELPFETPGIQIGMSWASARGRRPAHRWLRQTLASIVGRDVPPTRMDERSTHG